VKLFPRRTDFVARYGCEEFTVVLEEDGLSVAKPLAERLIAEAAAHQIDIGGQSLAVTVSIGIAEFSGEESAHDLIKRADSALYLAKKNGRNRCEVAETPEPAAT
jgi:diguanylate cyclase (GGDEF)-like protein